MARQDSDRDRYDRRVSMARAIDGQLGPFNPMHLRALANVPRERFVRACDESRAEVDAPLPLDDSGEATISAPHAYLLSYRLIDLREGDHVLELGSGSGYGAALASEIVGARGTVTTIEIDEALARRATELLADRANVRAVRGDAMTAAPLFAECNKIVAAFAVFSMPSAWTEAMRANAVLVAPVGVATQKLVRVERDTRGVIASSAHGEVRYVPNRSM